MGHPVTWFLHQFQLTTEPPCVQNWEQDGVEAEEEGGGDREGRPGVGRLPQGAGGLRRADGVGGLGWVNIIIKLEEEEVGILGLSSKQSNFGTGPKSQP